MSSLCLTCTQDINRLTDEIFSDSDNKVTKWYKMIGNYSLLPPPVNGDSRFNWFNKKGLTEIIPKHSNQKYQVNLHDVVGNLKNTWIFFWAANARNYRENRYEKPWDAYGKFKNSGLIKTSKKGDITLKFVDPQPYGFEGTNYPPHLHFTYLKKDHTWATKVHTIIVTPIIKYKQFKSLLKRKDYLIINAVPKKYDKRNIKKTVRIPFELDTSEINNRIIKNLPPNNKLKDQDFSLVVYCRNRQCDASEKLIKKLRQLGYINIVRYKGGMDDYFKN